MGLLYLGTVWEQFFVLDVLPQNVFWGIFLS